MIFTDDDMKEAESHPILGPEYFASRRFMERFMAGWENEHLQPLADTITSTVSEMIREKVWDDFRDWLLIDTETNAHGAMRDMVRRSVQALLSGEEWALKLYPLASDYQTEKVRAEIAKLIPDEIAKARIADLEKELADMRQRLDWANR